MDDPLSPPRRAQLDEGRALFNAQRFFEAHEVWERAWRAEQGEPRALFQGLIQVAAGYFKALSEQNAVGAAKLLEMGLERLGPFPDRSLGLSLGAFRSQVARDLGQVQRWLATGGPVPLDRGPTLEAEGDAPPA